jgi:hypothetical protein
MICSTASGWMPIAARPSPTGFTSWRPRCAAIAASNPVSTTKVPCGPTMAQTKYASGCRTSCGSPPRKFSGDIRS